MRTAASKYNNQSQKQLVPATNQTGALFEIEARVNKSLTVFLRKYLFMSITLVLLALLAGALVIPGLGDDGDEGEENPRDDAIKGTPGPDNPLEGTAGPDLILGFQGDDVIVGNGGEDEILGGGGEDMITGGADRDIIEGGADNDMLFGLGGNDTIEGGGGDDKIDAGEGNDIVRAGHGNDTVYGNTGTDLLRGEDGNDDVFLWGEGGTAIGGEGADDLIMVTGRGTLDGTEAVIAGGNTYYAFANDDDEQQTVAIIEQLFAADSIVMTIDTNDAAAADKPLTIEVTEGTINGQDGYNIEVSFLNESDEPTSFETARVFVLGRSIPIEDVADAVQVDVTVDASLTVEGAQATFDNLTPNDPQYPPEPLPA